MRIWGRRNRCQLVKINKKATFEVFVGTDLQSARDQQIKWPNPYCKFASCLPKQSKTKEFLFASKLWRRAAAVCCIVDGWVDHWCTDVFLVGRVPNRNTAALLPKSNLRNDQFLHRGLQVLHY
ncbi:uncharacterized protein LOC124311511 [Daphnia pulicaria]|uniref:uncharacterized protein LOC124311511 n=1 Tax=Daphnia pulicaria TaxID=35523 RepID=UPI001EEBAF65|nr:uncharacterized protein LOC124311511 [Daphnia pulicaria]